LLLPEIRDYFDLTNAQALGLVSATTIAVLLIEVPLSFYVDRGHRVRIAMVGAGLWGFFSIGTGLATSVVMLVAMRIGAGTGRSVVTPTHGSLLSDYYAPTTRVKVFSFHRQANSVGLILGPAIAGVLSQAFGWRTPFFVFAIPTLIFVVLAARLREPVRGEQERLAVGLTGDAATLEEAPPTIRATFPLIAKVKTVKRIWWAMPFLAMTLLGTQNLLSLVYKDVYHLKEAARGGIAAGIEPLQIVGVFVAIPIVARIALKDPGFLLRFIAVVGIFNSVMLVGIAYAPNLAVAIVCNAFLSATVGTLAPAFFAMLSIVAPANARAVTFSTISVFGIPGILILLPVIGALADNLGVQQAMLTMIPITLITAFILSSASRFVADDIANQQAALLGNAAPVAGD
jgi:MFS family permease